MRIRLSRGSLSFLILFLGLVFGGRELPELLSLADDVSNDGVMVGLVCPKGSRSSVPSRENESGALAYIVVLTKDSHLTDRILPQGLRLMTGRSLLRLLSLQRK
jgi:hypothetical protein